MSWKASTPALKRLFAFMKPSSINVASRSFVVCHTAAKQPFGGVMTQVMHHSNVCCTPTSLLHLPACRSYSNTSNSEEVESTDSDDVESGAEGDSMVSSEVREVDWETSLMYMNSEAYATTYGDRPVWYHYRANHKGARPRKITRKSCIRRGKMSTGNPCPICRDEYLVIDYRNIKLLNQFLYPNGRDIIKPARTQICMSQYRQLLIALEKAKDVGLIENKELNPRFYDYSQYYPKQQGINETKS